MHSAGLELTNLTYTRLEDNPIRHRGDRYTIVQSPISVSCPSVDLWLASVRIAYLAFRNYSYYYYHYILAGVPFSSAIARATVMSTLLLLPLILLLLLLPLFLHSAQIDPPLPFNHPTPRGDSLTYILTEDRHPVIRASVVLHTACKYDSRRNLRSDS